MENEDLEENNKLDENDIDIKNEEKESMVKHKRRVIKKFPSGIIPIKIKPIKIKPVKIKPIKAKPVKLKSIKIKPRYIKKR